MKKLLLVLFFVITVTISGCQTNDESADDFTFSVLYNERETNPFQEDWKILEEYKTRQNVTLDIRLGDDANYEESIALNMSSESPTDVILKVWPETVESYANDGLILPISDYEDLMPNYQAYIENYDLEDELDKLRLSNGKYYVLPGYQRSLQVQQWIYRKDVFEEHNIDVPTTYDELYDALLTLKGIYPESTPITASWGGAHLFSMMGAGYGIPAGWSGTRFYNETTDTWEFAPATNNYKEMYRFLNRIYSSNILDPDTFTQSNDEFTEKIVNGKALVTVTWISSGFDTWNQQLEANGINGGEWAALPVMESTIGISKLPPVNRFRKGIAITSSAAEKPYFEDMLRFLDWAIYSDEGSDLTYWGTEDLTYKNTSLGKELLSNIYSSKNPDGAEKLEDFGFVSFFDLCENEAFENYKKPDEIVTFLERSVNENETLNNPPNLVLNDDAIELIGFIEPDLLTYVNGASMKFITGELSVDADWDLYISELESLGYLTLETIWKNAWNEQNND